MTQRDKHDGFTLIELLVVIGIMVLLMAIIVPIGRRLKTNNSTTRCEAQLAHIGQALRIYYLDENGVPPVGVEGTLAGGPTSTVVDHKMWPGLEVLWRLDYLRNRDVFHCPSDLYDSAGNPMTKKSPEYYESYTGQDTNAKPAGDALKQYKYMPYRWATPAAYPNDYRRQLTQAVVERTIGSATYLVTSWSPDLPPDDTIVTWCNYHADSYELNGHGQYVVLYWDDSVKLLDQELFTDDTVAPTEAWLVKPTDTAH